MLRDHLLAAAPVVTIARLGHHTTVGHIAEPLLSMLLQVLDTSFTVVTEPSNVYLSLLGKAEDLHRALSAASQNS